MAKALKAFKAELLADKNVREAYEDLAPEYVSARAAIKARTSCGPRRPLVPAIKEE